MTRSTLFRHVVTLLFTIALMLGGVVVPGSTDRRLPLKMWQEPLSPGLTSKRLTGGSPVKEETAGVVKVSAIKTIFLTADTEIREASPSSILGQQLPVYIGFRDSQRSRMLLDIPLWDLPPGVQIDNATLKIHLSGWGDYEGMSRTITAYRVTSLWHEMLATWNHAPSTGEAVGSVSMGMPAVGTWYSIDLTNLVRAWYNGTYPDFGISLAGPEGGDPAYRVISSSETTNYPRLEVTYTPQAPTLSAAPASFAFLTDGSATPQAQTLNIQNTGSDPLQWQASAGSSNWITLTETSGTVSAGSSIAIGLNVITTGLSYGTYSGQVQVSSSTSGVQGSPQNRTVILHYSNSVRSVYLPTMLKNRGAVTSARKAVALLIGIADYQYLSPAPSEGTRAGVWGYDLMYAKNDPKREKLVLENLNFFSSTKPGADEVMVLTESQATLTNIKTAFEWLATRADETTTVFFAYSGHGGKITDGSSQHEFIAAYDTYTDATTFYNVIRDDDLDRMLSELKSKNIIVALDTCYSGGMAAASNLVGSTSRGLGSPLTTQTQIPSINAQRHMALSLAKPGRIILTASTVDQVSSEFGELDQGVFSYYLVMALMDPAADIDRNGWVSAEEAYAYLAPKVDSYAFTETGTHQNPQLNDGVSGNVDVTHP